ncbi:hypothetical protein SSS_01235 [Sarcoptes scabiei]|uniref:Uncharacterized protein n=1 Tax=Sarcoptes scabiei TaxID=52283 RepID=A0A834VCY8_SARSC|nr:hypothetical protein SSS_01235 [Sarcoptes scabiei]
MLSTATSMAYSGNRFSSTSSSSSSPSSPLPIASISPPLFCRNSPSSPPPPSLSSSIVCNSKKSNRLLSTSTSSSSKPILSSANVRRSRIFFDENNEGLNAADLIGNDYFVSSLDFEYDLFLNGLVNCDNSGYRNRFRNSKDCFDYSTTNYGNDHRCLNESNSSSSSSFFNHHHHHHHHHHHNHYHQQQNQQRVKKKSSKSNQESSPSSSSSLLLSTENFLSAFNSPFSRVATAYRYLHRPPRAHAIANDYAILPLGKSNNNNNNNSSSRNGYSTDNNNISNSNSNNVNTKDTGNDLGEQNDQSSQLVNANQAAAPSMANVVNFQALSINQTTTPTTIPTPTTTTTTAINNDRITIQSNTINYDNDNNQKIENSLVNENSIFPIANAIRCDTRSTFKIKENGGTKSPPPPPPTSSSLSSSAVIAIQNETGVICSENTAADDQTILDENAIIDAGGVENLTHQHLHALHRFRQQKKKGLITRFKDVVISFSPKVRSTVVNRDEIFSRYGREEREALAEFDFLDSESRIETIEEQQSETLNDFNVRRISFDDEFNMEMEEYDLINPIEISLQNADIDVDVIEDDDDVDGENSQRTDKNISVRDASIVCDKKSNQELYNNQTQNDRITSMNFFKTKSNNSFVPFRTRSETSTISTTINRNNSFRSKTMSNDRSNVSSTSKLSKFRFGFPRKSWSLEFQSTLKQLDEFDNGEDESISGSHSVQETIKKSTPKIKEKSIRVDDDDGDYDDDDDDDDIQIDIDSFQSPQIETNGTTRNRFEEDGFLAKNHDQEHCSSSSSDEKRKNRIKKKYKNKMTTNVKQSLHQLC